jgi:PilZ domain-containing protein
MIEQRKFPRIRFDARCVLHHGDCAYEGKVVNISLGGAMLSLDEGAMIPQEEQCLLRMFTGKEDAPAEIEVSIVYSAFSCIGCRFLAFDEKTHPALYAQIEELSSNPEKYRVAFP